jgi:hypothetical protein
VKQSRLYPLMVFWAWALSPMAHTGLWFLWQATIETIAPAAPEWIRRPDWYAFVIVCLWLTLAARFIHNRLRKT